MSETDVSKELVKIAQDAYDEFSMRAAIEAIAPALIAESHKTRCAESRHDWKLATDQPPLRIYSVCKWCRAKSYPPDYSPQEIK